MSKVLGFAINGDIIKFGEEKIKCTSFTVNPMSPTLYFSSEDWTYQTHKQEFTIVRTPAEATGELTVTPNNDYKPNPIRDIIIEGDKVTVYTSSISKDGSDNGMVTNPNEKSKFPNKLIFKIDDVQVDVSINWNSGSSPW